jgi:hypothetical protein
MDEVVKEFDFENGHYEVRKRITPNRIEFAAFSNGKQASGYTLSKSVHQTGITEQMLIDLTEMDIKDRIWESNVAAWREIQLEKAKT